MVPPYFTDTGMRSRLCPPPAVKLRDVFTKQLHHAPLIIRLLSVFAVICYLFPSTLVSYVAILAYCARFVNPLLSDAPSLRRPV